MSQVQLFAASQTVALQAPLFTDSCRQEYWSGLPFPSPGDLSHPGIKPGSLALQADSLLSELPRKTLEKKKSYTISDNMDEPERHYAK